MQFFKSSLLALIYVVCVSAAAIIPVDGTSADALKVRQLEGCVPVSDSVCCVILLLGIDEH